MEEPLSFDSKRQSRERTCTVQSPHCMLVRYCIIMLPDCCGVVREGIGAILLLVYFEMNSWHFSNPYIPVHEKWRRFLVEHPTTGFFAQMADLRNFATRQSIEASVPGAIQVLEGTHDTSDKFQMQVGTRAFQAISLMQSPSSAWVACLILYNYNKQENILPYFLPLSAHDTRKGGSSSFLEQQTRRLPTNFDRQVPHLLASQVERRNNTLRQWKPDGGANSSLVKRCKRLL